MNAVFVSEKSGTYAINGDMERIIHLLMDLKQFIEKRSPKKIHDVGCGTEIVSLWLSKMLPDSEFTVIDFSINSLNLEKKWSEIVGDNKILYLEMSYEEYLKKK